MKWLVKMVDWFLRETWWRRYYNRITLDEKKQHGAAGVWFVMLELQVIKVLAVI